MYNINSISFDFYFRVRKLNSPVDGNEPSSSSKSKKSKDQTLLNGTHNNEEKVTPGKRKLPPEEQAQIPAKNRKESASTLSSSSSSSSDSSDSEEQVQFEKPNTSTLNSVQDKSNNLEAKFQRRRRKRTRGKRKQKPVVFNPATDLDENGFLIDSRHPTPHPEPRVERLTKLFEKKNLKSTVHQKPSQQDSDSESTIIEEPEEENEDDEMYVTPQPIVGSVKKWCPNRLNYIEESVLSTITQEEMKIDSALADTKVITVNNHNGTQKDLVANGENLQQNNDSDINGTSTPLTSRLDC